MLGAGCPRGEAPRGQAPRRADGGHAEAEAELLALAAEELSAELQQSPATATWLGDHRYDDRLDDVHAESVTREIARLRAAQERLRRLADDPAQRPRALRLDMQLLRARLQSQLLDLSDLRPHERNPVFYMNLVAGGIDGLLQPEFLPAEGRVRALSRRLRAVPELCRQAARNLKNPPELSTKKAIELGQDTRDFLATLLPRLVRGVGDARVLEEFNKSNDEARKALEDLIQWMNKDLLPRSKGEWVLSREMLLAKLQAQELLDVPLEAVAAAAERELKETRAHLEETARQLTGAAGRPIGEAQRLCEEDHGKAEDLLRTTEAALAALSEAAGAVLTPPAGRPRVAEMPPYRWGFATLASPGPLETRTKESFFYVDPVDPAWTDKKRVSDHLRVLNRAQLWLLVLHEGVPGHFVQQEALRQAAPGLPLVRQRERSVAFAEGWAHYAEGLGLALVPAQDQDKLRFLQLRGQLLRLGRLLAVLRLHVPTGAGVPSPSSRLDDAAEMLSEECYLDDYAARREAERAAIDPMMMLPALGRLQLLKLRRDYEAQEGAAFSVVAFHDQLLRQGELPIPALRQLLLKEPGVSVE